MIELKIKNDEIRKLMNIETPVFPKYVSQILNLANQNAQATRPNTVGQMSELIKEFDGKTIEEWESWYLEKYPDSIEKATQKIKDMIEKFREALDKIDENMIRKWVRDLVIVKTFIGLKFQEAILKKIAENFDIDYRIATSEEESKGIDGYLDGIPVSIKPKSYKIQSRLSEKINVPIIYYEKQKDGIKIFIPENLEKKLYK